MKKIYAYDRTHQGRRFSRLFWLAMLLGVAILTTSCGTDTPVATSETSTQSASTSLATASNATPVIISATEAQTLLDTDPTAVLIDVRTPEEYASGHIPGAILLPVSEINDRKGDLPADLDTPIIVYCRSGNRSAQAAQALVELGYAKVYDLGGIGNWTGDLVR